ncbi:hypothetical protein E2562_016233 [Oryza meyeriana var. granulata]|uniref:Uncharacterized protein n=1 Tax=Oryza meyeriana var. granulata TaxID=110450 RepID=A0A6G1CRD6_9ORYZ|nr:hypothetical protein E2562_016233 [Oryza meyeriana var. granulata]
MQMQCSPGLAYVTVSKSKLRGCMRASSAGQIATPSPRPDLGSGHAGRAPADLASLAVGLYIHRVPALPCCVHRCASAMADVLLGSERRILISGYGLPPPPESLLGRLDQIDLRLRQLEEQRRGPTAAQADEDGGGDVVRRAPAVRHQHTKSLPSALQHVQVKGNLMDRLNLLESRIRQLSCELDGGVPAEDSAWSEPPLPEPCKDQAPVRAAAGSWSAAHFLHKGARQHHRTKPNPSKNLKEAKCACEKEKRKAGRRWFTVGC